MITIRSGQQAPKGPNERLVCELSWDDSLAVEAELDDEGEITITTEDEDGSPTLVADELALLDGNRSARVRLSGGQLGARYRVAHRISTTENPEQTKEKSFFILIEPR